VTTRRGPKSELPFGFHGWYWSGLWRRDLYGLCVGSVVANRNEMKRFVGSTFSFLMQKNGRISCFEFVDDEAQMRCELLGWLRTWVLEEGLAEALLKEANFAKVGAKSWAVSTPGVPKKICFRVKGVGSLKTDLTPYPDGTSEFELDPELDKRLRSIEASLSSLVGVIQHFTDDFNSLVHPSGNGVVDDAQKHLPEYLR